MCAAFGYGPLAEVPGEPSIGRLEASVNDAGMGCTRAGSRNPLFYKVNVTVACGAYEGGLERYGARV